MARSPKIRFRRKDLTELKRLEHNVRNKQSRIRKKFGIEVGFKYLPIQEIKAGSRSDFNKYKRQLHNFTNRNAHRYYRVNKMLSVPYNEWKEYTANLAKANKIRKKYYDKYKDLPLYSGGKPVGITVSQQKGFFARTGLDIFEPLSEARGSMRTMRDFKYRFNNAKRKSTKVGVMQSLKQMQDNYLHAFENKLFYSSAEPGEDARRIWETLQNMSFDDFYRIYLSEPKMSFDFVYGTEDRQATISVIDSALERAGAYKNG